MKAASSSAAIELTAQTKKPSSRYFRPRRGMSSQRGSMNCGGKAYVPAATSIRRWFPPDTASCRTPCGTGTTWQETRSAETFPPDARRERDASARYRRFISPAIGSQPSTPAGRCREVGCTARLKLPYPEAKDGADPDIQQQKGSLKSTPQKLRVVMIVPPDQLLFRLRGGRRNGAWSCLNLVADLDLRGHRALSKFQHRRRRHSAM